jgi:DNA-binding transcriptional LysR family regulator
MVLTAQGAIYLRYAENILDLSAQASRDVKDIATSNLQHLRFAMIEDFESDIGPEITQLLANMLPGCHFTHYTRVSHDILEMLKNRALDIAIATQPQVPLANVREYPVLRDPFVVAVPATMDITAEDCITGQSGLPFLRYMRTQIMGALIEAQLSRMRIKLENTFELDSTSSIMSLVARGSGWAITTPSNYARSKRFQPKVRLLPLPRKSFGRTISMFVAEPHLEDLAQVVATALRSQLSAQTIAPIVDMYPWMSDSYRLILD